MKDHSLNLIDVYSSDVRTSQAIKKIQTWVNQHYPVTAARLKSKLILECLIELREEQRLLSRS